MNSNPSSPVDRFVLLLLAASLATNSYLAILVFHPVEASARPTVPTALGATLSSISGRDLRGDVTALSFETPGRSTLLYAFTTSCPWCKANAPNLRALVTTQGKSLRIVGLALDNDISAVKAYLAEFRLDLPLVLIPDGDTTARLHLSAVPQTILVSSRGVVEKVWNGAYSGSLADDISKWFGIELPGLMAK